MARFREKLRKNTLLDRPLIRIGAKIDNLFGWPSIRVRAKIEKETVVVELWLWLGQK